MMKILAYIFILMMAFLWNSCASKPSAIDELKKRYRPDDRVNSMRLPDQPGKEKESMIQSDQPQTLEDRKEGQSRIDISSLSGNKKSVIEQLVVVTEEKVPLYKGPGPKFKQMAFAYQDQKFKLLRTTKGEDDSTSWHLIKDKNDQSFFISTASTRVIERKAETSRKVVLSNRESADTVNSQGLFDPTPPIPEELLQAKHLTLNFEQTDIYEVITTFCELLKINYIIEGKVQGKITLQTFRKVPTEDLYSVFEQILAVNGITVVKSGNFYRFVPIRDSSKKPLSLHYGNKPEIPNKDRVVIQLIPLKNLPPATIKKTIAPLITKNGILLDVPETNILMLIDLASSAKQITRVVEALDTDKISSSDIQLYTINHSDPKIMVEELNEIFGSMGYSSSLNKSLMFIPLARINSILVVSSLEDVIERVDFWVEKLDQPISAGELSTFVYYIQNAEATKLASVLNTLYGSQSDRNVIGGPPTSRQPSASRTDRKTAAQRRADTQKTPSPSPNAGTRAQQTQLRVRGGVDKEPTGEVYIIPDEDTNSLIIRTAPKNYASVLEIIKKLDLLPQQVLIEVLILDLTLDEETRTGVEWALKGTVGNNGIANGDKMVAGSLGSSGSLGAELANTATSLFAPGASFFVRQKDRFIGLLQAFASDSKVNVVANPILITSDNKEANISVTDDIPIASNTSTSLGSASPVAQNTIEFRSVGIKLGIIPKINSDNFVNLKIDQEISNRGPDVQTSVSVSSDGDTIVPNSTPSFTTRTMKTEVVLKDNEVLIMGGLIRTTQTETVTGVPFLMDIPFIGRLFSTHGVITKQTELMLFITPHIISNTDDSNFVTKQFKRKLGVLRNPPKNQSREVTLEE
jgi:general secretion pathway protein D